MSLHGKSINAGYAPEYRDGKRAYTGKILHVDLSSGEMRVEEPPEAYYRRLIGGRGIILDTLLRESPPGLDPLSPENPLIFAAGLLTGTVLPGTGRHAVGAKSPLTGALASGEAGGWWGSELKRAGFDAVVVRGRAAEPVYLWIHNGAAEIRDARPIWGMETAPTQDWLAQELGDASIRVAQIGPAGERLARIASVMHDVNRAAGRSGIGAVMGSKNLKAVAVRGKVAPGLVDRSLMATLARWISADSKTSMGWAKARGTSGSVAYNYAIGALAVQNYQEGLFPDIAQVDGENLFQFLVKDRDTCQHCPVKCKIVIEHHGKVDINPRYGGPEYETIGGMGPLCMVSDPVAVAKAHELCAAKGLDTISTAGTIAFAMECADRGLLAGFDFQPHFGDGDDLIHSIELIAAREGLGDLMAEGSARMAARLGGDAPQYVVASRGQEFPMHDPRLKNAMGLGYALSATGADHMHNLNDTFATSVEGSDVCARLQEMGVPVPLPLYGLPPVKIQAFIYETAFKNFLDSAVICHFYPYTYHHIVDALRAATGWDVSAEEINEIGTRLVTMGRLYLLREGFTAADDRLPARAYQPVSEGPIAGKAFTPELLEEGLQSYFRMMGWDTGGIPGPKALAMLGL